MRKRFASRKITVVTMPAMMRLAEDPLPHGHWYPRRRTGI